VRSVDSACGPLEVFLPPVTIDGVEPVMKPVPAVGQHTEAILHELGVRAPAEMRDNMRPQYSTFESEK